ncbi:MAG: 2-oxoacid:acceptor oxidoreductase family protein [Candidatus Helarchaeota archaeon]|nr:2-oxoacid:acceptor oxidoreductase family protein [Candidatus Helarchaeota archaeon]
MRIWNMLICGIGGQGVMLIKRILENAALREKLQGGKIRKMIGAEKHGLSQREGATDVYTRFLILEPNEKYDDLLLTSPTLFYGDADLAIGVEPVELLRNAIYFSEKTFIILNTRSFPPCAVISGLMEYPSIETIVNAIKDISGSSKILLVDASTIAIERFNNALRTNMILLGVTYATNHLPLKLSSIQAVIREKVPEPDDNLTAFDYGIETGKKLMESI